MKPHINGTPRSVPVCAGSLGEAVHLVSLVLSYHAFR